MPVRLITRPGREGGRGSSCRLTAQEAQAALDEIASGVRREVVAAKWDVGVNTLWRLQTGRIRRLGDGVLVGVEEVR